MKGFQATRYDDVPYLAAAYAFTHPEVLATTAMLRGLVTPPLEGARVLELGCARGANLVPMAFLLPDTRFVGIDRSERQIEEGLERVRAAGLTNVDLRALDLRDVDASLGLFDYVICHGVFSWVGRETQEKILEVASRNLSPGGVLYLSYNTFPGWHISTMFRDMMLYHVRDEQEPARRAARARAFIRFLADSTQGQDSIWAFLLREEASYLDQSPDWYLLHDDLEEENHPLYFFQLVERAQAHGLSYLAEERALHPSEIFPPKVWKTLESYGLDRVGHEQHADFLRNTRFRRSLFCHADAVAQPATALEAVRRCRVRTHVRPSGIAPGSEGQDTIAFSFEDGRRVSTNDPRLIAVLRALYDAWPRTLAFEQLAALVAEATGALSPADGPGRAEETARMVFQAMHAQLVSLHLTDPPIAVVAAERPLASPVARLQAAAGEKATNLLLRQAEMGPLDLRVLSLLDGKHDRAALLAAIADLGTAAAPRPLEEQLEETLTRLAVNCYLLE